ncbi:MAG: hypothetical protein RLZZ316_38 [Bacteroidota bacterium]
MGAFLLAKSLVKFVNYRKLKQFFKSAIPFLLNKRMLTLVKERSAAITIAGFLLQVLVGFISNLSAAGCAL